MKQKNYSIFKALEQYPNISVEEFEPEFLAENVMNKTQKIHNLIHYYIQSKLKIFKIDLFYF